MSARFAWGSSSTIRTDARRFWPSLSVTRSRIGTVPLREAIASLYRINSIELVTRLRERKSVLIVPGDHFGMDGYLRIGYGEETDYLKTGLNRLHELLVEIGARRTWRPPSGG